jgi:phage terminase small subunit
MEDDETIGLGPAMESLTEKQRRFVMAIVDTPGITQGEAARAAGYQNSEGGYRVQGHMLARNPAIQQAIREFAGARLNSNSLLGAEVLVEISRDPEASHKDRMKAAVYLLDRSGFGAAQTINVNKTVTRKVDASEAALRIAEFRQKFPEQFAKLLGAPEPVAVDGEFSEVTDE